MIDLDYLEKSGDAAFNSLRNLSFYDKRLFDTIDRFEEVQPLVYKLISYDGTIHYYDPLYNRVFGADFAVIDSEQKWRKMFSYKLHRAIATHGMSQQTFSELTGISEHTLSKYVMGNATPSSYNLKKICSVLGVPTDFFMEF